MPSSNVFQDPQTLTLVLEIFRLLLLTPDSHRACVSALILTLLKTRLRFALSFAEPQLTSLVTDCVRCLFLVDSAALSSVADHIKAIAVAHPNHDGQDTPVGSDIDPTVLTQSGQRS